MFMLFVTNFNVYFCPLVCACLCLTDILLPFTPVQYLFTIFFVASLLVLKLFLFSLLYSGLAGNVDMAAVPAHLKCALSNTLLREAVTLPCCSQVCFFCLCLFI